MEYRIINAPAVEGLELAVRRMLSQGWEPQGGPFGHHSGYGQAMIRNKNLPPAEAPIVPVLPPMSPQDTRLFNALKEKRMEIAASIGIPAYCVATNKTLINMVEMKPLTIEQLQTVFGFGPAKIRAYGDPLLRVVLENT